MAVLAAGLMVLASMQPIEELAAVAGVDPIDLAGAVSTTGLEPLTYLRMTGELPTPQPPAAPLNAAVERRLDCIAWHESRNVAGAVNPRSGASGLFQFLGSTWATTPQGRAGYSPFNAQAAREAARWMISQGRIREWDVVRMGLC